MVLCSLFLQQIAGTRTKRAELVLVNVALPLKFCLIKGKETKCILLHAGTCYKRDVWGGSGNRRTSQNLLKNRKKVRNFEQNSMAR